MGDNVTSVATAKTEWECSDYPIVIGKCFKKEVEIAPATTPASTTPAVTQTVTEANAVTDSFTTDSVPTAPKATPPVVRSNNYVLPDPVGRQSIF
ncbi:MAG: hypothetical protein ACD_62C00675G0003 [uncultured bacterium]|nr:MAG: hypothetical protein ACD_62C00675G0003 [uncultured bacterium]